MAATGTPTPNLGLRIPIGTDPASVDDINYNSNLLDTKLGPVGSDSVQDQIDALNSKIANIVYITKTVTVPANGSVQVDFSSSIPTGKTLVTISSVRLNNYVLPYFDGNNRTWVELANDGTNIMTIKNTAAAWTNYTLRFVAFVG